MKLQTHISITPERNQIDYTSKVLLLGSCFTSNIGGKLDYFKFKNLQNPFGIVFHPLAIEKLVTRAINQDYFVEDDIFFHNEQWHCYEVHSMLDASGKDEMLRTLNKQLEALKDYLISTTHIILTFGTAWVYRHIESDLVVANCHKIPQKKFLKELLSVSDISESIEATLALIRSINPKVVFIQTLSPVRHIKDGFVKNSQSKAHLLAGIHEVVEPRNLIHYFPSFEIMMDELREYRFYTKDMLHPNETAIDIIWSKFKDAWISAGTETLQKEIDSIQSGLNHRPFNPSSEAHIDFKKKLQLKIENIISRFPHISF